jgi:hypothetical protein
VRYWRARLRNWLRDRAIEYLQALGFVVAIAPDERGAGVFITENPIDPGNDLIRVRFADVGHLRTTMKLGANIRPGHARAFAQELIAAADIVESRIAKTVDDWRERG